LGLLYASRLSRVVPTALIARSEARAAELRRGVRVGKELYRPQVFGPAGLPHADLAVILVKAYDTAVAVRLARRMKPKALLSLQNGLVDNLPQGVSTAGAYRDGRNRVVVATTGETLLPPGFDLFASRLRRAGLRAHVTSQIDRARYRKLLANVCINPLTAIFHIRNGEVRNAPYLSLTKALAREAAQVLGLAPRQAIDRVLAVARATAANRSSMLQDLEAGRRTEIGELTGALLRIAQRNRVKAPTHRALLQIVRVMEAG
jgi:2-dehydropantoate 2-reductase